MVLHIQPPGHYNLVFVNGNGKMLVTRVRRNVHQSAAGVRSVGDLDGVDRRVSYVLLLYLTVDVCKGSGYTVESSVSYTFVTVVEILAS